MTSTKPIRFVRPPRQRRETGAIWIQMPVALLAGASFFFLVIAFISLSYRLAYSGRIFPGVSVAGVNLSGLNLKDAAIKIQATLTFPESGSIVFRNDQNVWVASPANLGMQLDAISSAQLAFNFGRAGGLFRLQFCNVPAAIAKAPASPVVAGRSGELHPPVHLSCHTTPIRCQ